MLGDGLLARGSPSSLEAACPQGRGPQYPSAEGKPQMAVAGCEEIRATNPASIACVP